MDFKSNEISELLKNIDQFKRRTISDYSEDKPVNYIDFMKESELLKTSANHIIYARRGCGKTTLLLKLQEKNNYFVPICFDCEKMNDSYNDIILTIIKDLINKIIIELIKTRPKIKILSLYSVMKKRNEYKKLMVNANSIYYTAEKLLQENEIQEYEQNTSIRTKKKNEVINEAKCNTFINGSALLNSESVINKICCKIDSCIGIEYTSKNYNEEIEEKENVLLSKNKITIKKEKLVNDFSQAIIEFLSIYREITKKAVYLFLDDFYQIQKTKQPYILQYFHNLAKKTRNRAFCFNTVSLPNGLKLNIDGENTFSSNNDYSEIIIDYPLSEMDKLELQLLNIIEKLQDKDKKHFTVEDIRSFFNKDETLKYLIMASGGIPRDFMTVFSYSIREAINQSKTIIDKQIVYDTVRELKKDKEESIGKDTELSKSIIQKAQDIIQEEIVDGLKTNVILYPIDKITTEHEVLLSNLVNLRYLHLIKENIVSENRKKECRAYLVDMTFYGYKKRVPGFDIRQFWIRDNKSRLSILSQSKVWSFPDEKINEIMKSK